MMTARKRPTMLLLGKQVVIVVVVVVDTQHLPRCSQSLIDLLHLQAAASTGSKETERRRDEDISERKGSQTDE